MYLNESLLCCKVDICYAIFADRVLTCEECKKSMEARRKAREARMKEVEERKKRLEQQRLKEMEE